MAIDGVLRVEPTVMKTAAESLACGAEQLLKRLNTLDGQVSEMLCVWRGSSGDAYSSAWELWHSGACEVHLGLSIMAKLLRHAGGHYADHESKSAEALGRVVDA